MVEDLENLDPPGESLCPECGRKIEKVVKHRGLLYHGRCFKTMTNFEGKKIAVSKPLCSVRGVL